VAVNVPNNPTGYLPDHDTWRALVGLCEARGVRLLADEVYRGIEPDPARTLPAAADLGPHALSLGVLSKAFGLPGLRVGWIACRDRGVLARLERCKHYTSICNAGPSEYLGCLAIAARKTVFGRLRRLVTDNARTVEAFFAERPDLFSWTPPDGGCVAFARYAGSDGVERFCADLLREHGVLLLPGSLYRSDLFEIPADRFRIGIGRRGLEEGLAAAREHVASLP
jgi:aspartate/methionine/tyrosine aminotransferase